MELKRNRPFGLLLFFAILAVSGVLVYVEVHNLAGSREQAVRLAEVQTRNLAQAMDQSISATVSRIDQALRTVTAEMERRSAEGHLDRPGMQRFIDTQQALLTESVAIRVTDAAGTVIINNPGGDPSATLKDRPFWAPLRDDPARGLFVSKPHLGIFTKRWIFSFARRYNLPDGRFGGVVVVPVFVGHFEQAVARFEVGPGGMLTLRDSEGGFVARHPAVVKGVSPAFGNRDVSSQLKTIMASGIQQQTFLATAPIDQTRRLLTFRRLSQVPLLVVAGLAEADFLSQWQGELRRTIIRLGAAILGFWILAGLLWHLWGERERSLGALIESRDGYRALFDLASEGIFLLSPEGCLVAVNQSFARMHGYTRDELVNTSLQELDTPATFESKPDRLRRLDAGETLTFEVEHIHKDGHTFPLEVSACKVSLGGNPGYLCFHRDITERRLVEEVLRENQARLQRAEHVAHFGSWELNLVTRRMRASAGAGLIYGLQGEEWELSEVQRMVLPDSRPVLDAALADLIERGVPYNVEYQVMRATDGELRTIHSVAEYDPIRRSLFGVINDVTDKKVAEAEKQHLQLQLQHAHKMDSLGSLAGGVAHDMNNVLGAILGLASVQAEQAPADSAMKRNMTTIATACHRGAKLVKGLLGFARQGLTEEKILDLNSLVKEEIELLERTTLQKVRLEADLAPDLMPVKGDSGALSHALLNLCVNAVDAMAAGGLLWVRTRNQAGGRVVLEIEDTGSGMPKEVLEKALDPFFTTKPPGQGTGLGLSIVYGTVKAHHGTLEIQSEPGKGTRVAISLPAAPPAAPLPAGGARQALLRPDRPLVVLLVDDDELMQSSIATVLETLGHTPIIASSGFAALTELGSGLRPDVIVLDMNMPGMDGEETLPLLRSQVPDVPILLATGRANQAAIDLVNAHPNVTLVPKPFDLQELQRHLEPLGRG